MPDNSILNAESRLSDVLIRLKQPDAYRDNLFELRDFVLYLDKTGIPLEPYLLRLASHLPTRHDPRLIIGTDPMDLWPLMAVLMRLSEFLPPQWTSFRIAIRTHIMLLFSFLGETRGMSAMMSEDAYSDTLILPRQSDSPTVGHLDRLSLLQSFRDDPSLTSDQRTEVDSCIRFWRDISRRDGLGVWIPVVDGNGDGLLRRIRIDALETLPQPMDTFHSDVAVIGAEMAGPDPSDIPSNAARSEWTRNHGQGKGRSVGGKLRYEFAHILHEGRSGDAGMAVLLYSAIGEATESNERHWPNHHAAFTGAVDGDGHFLPVSIDSIRPKIKATFFSWCSTLCVPSDQNALFQDEVNRLITLYPNRRLEIVPVHTLRDILADRRLVGRRTFSNSVLLANRAWRHRVALSTFTLILTLSIVALVAWMPPLDRNPDHFHVLGSNLIIKNRFGTELRQLPLHRSYWERYNPIYFRRHYILIDINEDGYKDIIRVHVPVNSDIKADGLIEAFDIRKNRLLWTIQPDFDLNFPNKPGAGDHFRPNHIIAHDGKLYFSFSDSQFFPGVIGSADLKTGIVDSSYYVHAGTVNDMIMIVDPESGSPFLIVAAHSNPFSGTVLIKLDPLNLFGHGPITPEYRLLNHIRGVENQYMLIPKTFVGQAMDPAMPRPVIVEIRYRPDDHSLVLNVRDGIYMLASNPADNQPPSASYEMFMSSDFTINSVQTYDSFDVMARRYLGQSGMETFNALEFFNHFTANNILYLENERWVKASERSSLQ